MRSYVNDPELNNNNIGDFAHGGGMCQTSQNDHYKQLQLGSRCQLVSCDVDMESGDCAPNNAGFENNIQPIGSCDSDFIFGRTPSEHSPPGFVAASSLVPSCSGDSSGGNIFERMKKAQLQMESKKCLNSGPGACHSCTRAVQARDVMKCQFCEHYVCAACTRQCSGCYLHFCQLCSILNYSDVKVKAFCFSCKDR